MKKLLIAFALLVFSSAFEASARKDFLRVEGTQVVDSNGTPFFIRGTNLGCWLNPEGYMFHFPSRAASASLIDTGIRQLCGPEYALGFWQRFVDSFITEQDIAYLAGTGVNTLRLPLHWKMFTDDRYLCFGAAEDGYRLLDKAVGWCRKYGIRLILDMHCCPGGQTGDNIDDSDGYPWLFREKSSQDLLVSIWKDIARRYRKEPAILGYDFMNEPVPHYFADKEELYMLCTDLYRRLCREVSKVDPNHILIIGGVNWNGRFSPYEGVDFGSNVMFQCHIYKCPPTVGSIKAFLRFRESSGKPMFMGETGENTDEWVEKFRLAMEKEKMGWTFWTYKKLDNPKGFFSIKMPEGWQKVCDFLAADRSSYAAIRSAREAAGDLSSVLDDYLENCRFEACIRKDSYIRALGFDPGE